MKKLFFLTLLLWISTEFSWAQNTILRGIVTDQTTAEPLIGVNVIANESVGTTTDISGVFELQLAPGVHSIRLSYIGFESKTFEFSLGTDPRKTVHLKLSPSFENLGEVVISGSKVKKRLLDEVVSIDVITPELISDRVSTNLADAVKNVSGLQVIDGQASIRGGSGYAYGTGSRVMVVVDGQPMLTGDYGDVQWNYVPIENIEQIEVVKGASSVLYGASALNGVIHIKTAEPRIKPYTKLTYYHKIIDNPKRGETAWWSKQPYTSGYYIAHRQKIGLMDLVLGANIHEERSYLERSNESRRRFTVKTRFRLPNTDRLTYGVDGNFSYSKEGLNLLWRNADDGILRALSGTDGEWEYHNWNIDPWVTYFDQNEGRHTLKSRFFRSSQIISRGRNDGSIFNLDYQYFKDLTDHLNIIAGASSLYFLMKNHDLGNTFGFINSVYGQADWKLGRFSLTAGTRLEYFAVDSTANKIVPSFRGGVNYAFNERNTARLSFGQGYRFPSPVERFADVDLGDYINIFPNPNLEPETGWNVELGYMKNFNLFGWKANADVALFWSEYENMIEFLFDLQDIESDNPLDRIGFRSENVSQTRIAGFELSLSGKGSIGDFPLRLETGYTYIYPVYLAEDDSLKGFFNYMKNFGRAFTEGDITSDALRPIMKYRFRHTLTADAETSVGKFDLGASLNYYSFMEQIDSVFAGESSDPVVRALLTAIGEPIPGVKAWREENNGGKFIVNLRAAYRINDKVKLLFRLENLLNEEYAIRPALIESPRSYSAQLSVKF